MAVAWFLCPYKRRNPGEIPPVRYCAMDDFTVLIEADGGRWAETEVLGNHAIVKVRALAVTLQLIAAEPGIDRIPVALLDDPLSSLTPAQRQGLATRVQALGYTLDELNEAFPGGLGVITLAQLLRFIARRRLKPRYDSETDAIVVDGPVQPVRSVESVDGEIEAV